MTSPAAASPRDLEGKVVAITGANAGIGLATARELARRGARLRLLCRSAARTAPVVAELKTLAGHDDVRFIAMDLGKLASVRQGAAELLALEEPLHILINNAGLAGQRGTTADGFEIHFGTNHLGHYLLTELLLPRLCASAPARIVNLSSRSNYQSKRPDWDAYTKGTRSYSGLQEYAQSKLCNILHARELATRLEGTGVTTYAVHPGVIASEIWKRIPPPFRWLAKALMKSTEDGKRSTILAATDPALAAQSGQYYDADGVRKRGNPLAADAQLAAELKQRSDAWVAGASA
jgi:retinol dehydrogenase-12